MKFIHTADLHLGKSICGVSMINLQEEALNQILMYASVNNIKVIVIAGDVYDRAIPSVEAVDLFDKFLVQATSYGISVIIISGNHDSEARLNFASSLLTTNNVHISSILQEHLKEVEIDDTIFYLLPFSKGGAFKEFDEELPNLSYQIAIERYLQRQSINKDKNSVLVTHHFVAGSIVSDSELPLSVGGTDQVAYSLFDDFDYVALGHIHAPQKIKRESLRYSGSPLRYSFDECKQNKSFTVVTIENHEVSVELVDFHVSKTLIVKKGLFEDLMQDSSNHYVAFELEDRTLIANAMDKLKVHYPNALLLSYINLHDADIQSEHIDNINKLDDITLFKNFYKSIRDVDLSDEALDIISNLLVGGDE